MAPNHDVSDAVDGLHDVCSHRTRRRLLRVLRTRSETTLEDVAAELAEGGDDTQARERARIEVALYHCHLPKMADRDVIEYDSESGRIRTTEATRVAWRLLQAREEAIRSNRDDDR
ncbi:DUF7344 domain-containing protein [Natronococcus occultus]|uniref:DUF7344 domain-containing protein n=1 Tax=Natronococcus occultus SP4 TaxID=694430 RepID=L0JUN9_9EURY|nr:hypothetical protein [Natronococcus occultus]AGB36742.1 hypothetical protein Natoc_0893 [Natronococcus occultus SP4]